MAKTNHDSRFLVVHGQGIVTAPPDLLLLSALIRCIAIDYSKSISKLNKKTGLMRNAVEQCGIPPSDIKTAFFSVNIDQVLKKKKYVRAFVTQHFLHVKVPLKKTKINAVFQAIAASGAEPKMTIAFDVAKPEVLKLKAIEAAVANARSRAQLIAQAADQKLGRIMNINYGTGSSQICNPRFSMEMMCGLMDHSSAPDLEPQEISATEGVTITWEVGS